METPAEETRDTRSQQEWQMAQQRLLRYLQLLKIPPVESLQLTLEALKLAMQAQERRRMSRSIPEAMRALRRLLAEKTPSSGAPHGAEDYFGESYLPQLVHINTGLPTILRSMPPLNRGSMVPEEVD